MSELHGNPESIRSFSVIMAEFCQMARDGLARIVAHERELGASEWTDENFKRFDEQFEPVVAALLRNVEQLESELGPHVRQMAERYDELLHG